MKQEVSTFMEKNTYANINLIDSLLDFQSDVKNLLELTNIEEWDGRIVKEREEKIREAALVLAGQYIAILLYKLSQSDLTHQTAINQTKVWWHPDTQRHGYRKREKLPLFCHFPSSQSMKALSVSQYRLFY